MYIFRPIISTAEKPRNTTGRAGRQGEAGMSGMANPIRIGWRLWREVDRKGVWDARIRPGRFRPLGGRRDIGAPV